MGDEKDEREEKPPEPPGEGDGIEDASREALENIRKRGTGHAGTGDIG